MGITNNEGLVPAGSECIDPGDGTGTYNTLEECQQNCNLSNLFPDTSVGCLFPFDPNHCSSCNTHDPNLCHLPFETGNGYYTYQIIDSCLCGEYNGQSYYSTFCCFNPDTPSFDPTDLPGVGPSY